MADETYPNVTFRAGGLIEDLQARGENLNSVAKRDLRRYYDALAASLPQFSKQEALLLCACLNSVKCTPSMLAANIACAEELTQWQGVDGPALLARLQGLSWMQSQAVIDAVERAWNSPEYSVNLEKRILLMGLAK